MSLDEMTQTKIDFDKLRMDSLLAMERRFAIIQKYNPAILYVSKVGDDWAALFISENALTLLGYSPKEFIESSDFWISHIHPDDRNRVLEGLPKIFETGSHIHEYRFLLKNGTYVWMHDESRLLYDENNKPTECIGIMMDITSRKRYEEELTKFDEQLQESVDERTAELVKALEILQRRERELQHEKNEADEARGRMETYLDLMTHDITNLITPLSSYANMIWETKDIPADVREYTDKFVRQMSRLETFLFRLRILTDAQNIVSWKSDSLNLKESISEIEALMRKKYSEKKINLNIILPGEEPVESVGGRYFREVVFEVIDNAVKHSHGKDVDINVNIVPASERKNKQFWRISIADSGPGMSDILKKSLTQTFDSPERDLRKVASGLSFASSIAKHFGGRLWIEDRYQDGTRKGLVIFIEIPQYSARRQRKAK